MILPLTRGDSGPPPVAQRRSRYRRARTAAAAYGRWLRICFAGVVLLRAARGGAEARRPGPGQGATLWPPTSAPLRRSPPSIADFATQPVLSSARGDTGVGAHTSYAQERLARSHATLSRSKVNKIQVGFEQWDRLPQSSESRSTIAQNLVRA